MTGTYVQALVMPNQKPTTANVDADTDVDTDAPADTDIGVDAQHSTCYAVVPLAKK